MNPAHLPLLRCPVSAAPLTLSSKEVVNGRVRSGTLSTQTGQTYRIVNFIPRFVPLENYAQSFGFQWDLHRRTQYDDELGIDESRSRLFEVSLSSRFAMPSLPMA